MSRRIGSLSIVVSLVACLSGAGPAQAEKPSVVRIPIKVATTLSNTAAEDTVSGRISSKKKGCLANRAVDIVESISEQPAPVATVKSGPDGSFSAVVPGGFLSGHSYFAFVSTKRLFKTKSRRGVCVAAQSQPTLATP